MNKVVKNIRWLLLALPGMLFLLSSCATNPQVAEGPKFYEADAANLVLRYSSDKAIFRLKPDGQDGNFYHIFSRQEICEADAKRAGQRDLAVVLIGYQFTPEMDRQIKQGWVDTLSKLNYRRVVILRCGESGQVNGLRVVEDRQNVRVVSASAPGGLGSMALAQ